MADGQLSVTLAADIQNFIKGLQDAAKQSTETGNSYNAAVTQIVAGTARMNSTNLAPITRTLTQVEAGLEAVRVTGENTSTSVTRSLARVAQSSATSGRAITAGSNQAAFALTNVGRVAQDLPFGFVGIQNNLNPLLESFQRLRAETGSGSAAFKALGQSLIGPAGLGIALSLVGAGILLYQQYQQKAAKASIDGAKSNEEYAKSLNTISQATGENLSKLSILYEASQDANRPLADRKRLVDALQQQYPAYFGNLKDEAILAGKAASAYENLQQQLINTAIVKASEGLLSTKFKALADLSISLAESEKKLRAAGATDAQAASARGRSVVVNEDGDIKAVRDYKNKISDEIKAAQKVFAGLTADFSVDSLLGSFTNGIEKDGAVKKVKGLSDVLKELTDNLAAINTQGLDLKSSLYLDADDTKRVQAYNSAIKELTDLGFNAQTQAVKELIFQRDKLYQLPQIKAQSVNTGTNAPLNSQGKTGSIGIKVTDTELEGFKKAIKYMTDLDKARQNLATGLDDLLKTSISGTLSNVGLAIGEALGNGTSVFQAAASALLGSFADFLSQFGTLLINYGIAAGAFGKLQASLLVPGAAILTAPLAIAAGIALKIASGAISGLISGGSKSSASSSNPITAFANGGVVYGPTNALIGEYAGAKSDPEVVAPLSKLKSIIGKGTNDNPRSNTNINLDGQFVLTGKDLALAIKRYENSNR